MVVNESDSIAIRAVIEGQLAAFQTDDAQIAFSLASPGIHEQFQTAENFMRMVRLNYPAIYRPRSVVFEKITTIQDNITQPVLLLSPHGVPLRALYFMEQQPDNSWKINGCILVSVEAEII